MEQTVVALHHQKSWIFAAWQVSGKKNIKKHEGAFIHNRFMLYTIKTDHLNLRTIIKQPYRA